MPTRRLQNGSKFDQLHHFKLKTDLNENTHKQLCPGCNSEYNAVTCLLLRQCTHDCKIISPPFFTFDDTNDEHFEHCDLQTSPENPKGTFLMLCHKSLNINLCCTCMLSSY